MFLALPAAATRCVAVAAQASVRPERSPERDARVVGRPLGQSLVPPQILRGSIDDPLVSAGTAQIEGGKKGKAETFPESICAGVDFPYARVR
ncbi:hypothetical protein GUJ93_ZPchr0014g46880 [Zizania palustris]|uniref:Uncharacterized protein n=1 Tax=Zizania palustris TaxID=103762 RepID=A0A8J5TL40_ZIZPA|nr:hypothetical protein GUJ93_ZPchr0014g46880 [Zizania palustris]